MKKLMNRQLMPLVVLAVLNVVFAANGMSSFARTQSPIPLILLILNLVAAAWLMFVAVRAVRLKNRKVELDDLIKERELIRLNRVAVETQIDILRGKYPRDVLTLSRLDELKTRKTELDESERGNTKTLQKIGALQKTA
jgi:uncharacterized integral membrane protein